MNIFFINTAEACSIIQDPNYVGDRSINWKSLIISSDACGTTYGPSPFLVTVSLSIVTGFILFFLFKKLKNGIQNKYIKISIKILLILMGLVFLWSSLISIGTFIGIF